jgi:hypothetical protein
MIDALKKLFRDVFTEPDGATICPVRVVGIFGTLQGLGLAAFDVLVQHAHFDLLAFGGGLGATIGALGVALGMKKDASA